MALTDNESKAGTSLLSGGLTEPLKEQPGQEEPIQLASLGLGRFGGKIGNFIGNTFFGKDLFSSRKFTKELESGQREAMDVEDIFIPPFLRPLVEEKEKGATIRTVKEKDVNPSEIMIGQSKDKDERDAKAQEFLDNRKVQAQPKKGLLTDFRVTGSQGDDKLPNEQSILTNIEAISQTHKGKINEAKRGEITNETLQDLADIVGTSPKILINNILGRKRGQVIEFEGMGLAETMLASRELLVNEISKLDELAIKAETGNERDALAFRQQFELVSQIQLQIKGSQTEIARALGQFKIPVKQTNTGQKQLINQDLTMLLDQYGGLEDMKIMATLYRQAETPEQKAQLARGTRGLLGKSVDAFYEAWINMLLSSPITHVKNVAGAFLTTFAHVPETYGAAVAGSVRRNVFNQKGGVQFGEANAELFGAFMAFGEAWKTAAKVYRTGETPIFGSKIEYTQGKRHEKAFSAEAFELGTMGNAVDSLGSMLTMGTVDNLSATAINTAGNIATLGRIPTRALEFEDTYFKVIGQRMSLYQQAFREAKTRGLQGDDFGEYIANYVYNPPKDAIQIADDHARYVTLQSHVDKAGKNLQNLRELPYLRFFVPFFKTPYNAFKYAFKERSPLGLFSADLRNTIRTGYRDDASSAQRAAADTAVAKLSMGSMTAGLVAMYAIQGRITGGGPEDFEYKDSLRRTRWQPYSIRIGDTYYSYAGAEPFSSVLSLAADVAETTASADMSVEGIGKLTLGISIAISNQMTDKTFMSGFSNLVDMLQDPERYGGMTVESFQRSLVPRVASQYKKTGIGLPDLDVFGVPLGIKGDPIVRDVRTFLDTVRAQIPGLSKTLPPRRNIWGQPIFLSGAYGPDMISPIYSSHRGPNKMLVGEKDVEFTYKMDELFVAVEYGPSKMPMEINADVPLTLEERNEYHMIVGAETTKELKKWYRKPNNIRKYNKLKDLYLATGSSLAKEEIESMFDLEILQARRKGLREFLKRSSIGRKYKRKLDKHEDELKAEMKSFKRAMR